MELISYHQPKEFGKGQKERGDANPHVLPAFQNSSSWNPSWLSDAHVTREDPESEKLARDNPETNFITIKPETTSEAAEQFSRFPLPPCSPPGCPFPIKSLALSVCVSPWSIQVLEKSSLLDLRRGPPSCNTLLPCKPRHEVPL